MDRQTVYFGQLAAETDVLKTGQNGMVALAKLAAGVLGNTSIVNGFTVIPTTPASLNVSITPGEIYQLENLEQSAWSSLSPDTHTILKQGLLMDAVTQGVTPPGTVGWSQVFLVEVQYQDIDTGSVVLPYYNAANPALPFSGPGNSGTAQNTVRKGVVATQVKAGIAAPTGTQVAPTADAGWVGIYTITVANGQTTITSGNIAQVSSAPFIPSTLPKVPSGVQGSAWTSAQDTGTASALSISLFPTPTLAFGLSFWVKAAASPTGPTMITGNWPTGGAQTVANVDGSAIAPNQWNIGSMVELFYDGTKFQIVSGGRVAGAPVYLTQALDYFVNSTTGSDANDGLAGTVGGGHGPFATLQKAQTILTGFNLNGFNVTVHVANGTYAALRLANMAGSGTVFWIGNVASPTSCIIAGNGVSAITGANCGNCHNITGFQVQTSGTFTNDGMNGIQISGTGTAVAVANIAWGLCNGSHFAITQGANVSYGGAMTVVGAPQGANPNMPSGWHVFMATNAILQPPGVLGTLTIPGAITCGNGGGWVLASGNCLAQVVYASISGAGVAGVIGNKFLGNAFSQISVLGNSTSYYPGNVAGTLSNSLYG